MAAGQYDIFIEQGATYDQTFNWKDSAGDPVNLTGYTARMQIRPSVSRSEIIESFTTENGKITLGGSAGTIRLLLTATQTAAITSRRGVYDLELIASNGVVTRLLEGGVEISREVTR